MNGSLRHRRGASVRATSSSTVRALPTSGQSAGRTAVPADDRDESADGRKQPPRVHYGTPVARRRFARTRRASSTTYNTLGPDGVRPGGTGDQITGIRRPGTVAAPDRLSNSLYRDASSADTPTQIVMGLEPEHVALDPLHRVVGHDLAPPPTPHEHTAARQPLPGSATAPPRARLGRHGQPRLLVSVALRVRPSGLNATDSTPSVCPVRRCWSGRAAAAKRLTESSASLRRMVQPNPRRRPRSLSCFRVATDRVTTSPPATDKTPVPLRDVFDVSTHWHRSLVGPLSCRTRPASYAGRVGHDAHRHPRG